MTDPTSDKTEGYHLFFEPTGEASALLTDTVQSLAQEYGGPLFAPHLTLLAKIPEVSEQELVEKSRTLAANLAPFTLTLSGFGAEGTYFRTLYMTVQNRDEVAKHHAQAREVFGGEDSAPYMPHLSLLYGMYDAGRKQHTINALQHLPPISYEVKSLTLWHTPGDASTWKKVGEFPFAQQA